MSGIIFGDYPEKHTNSKSEDTHTVGSHSDDRGGEADFPCDCEQRLKRNKEIPVTPIGKLYDALTEPPQDTSLKGKLAESEPKASAAPTIIADTSLDDRPRAVQNGMSQAEYDTWMFLSDKEALDKPYTYAVSSSDLAKLLAKQQAKLLQVIEDEVIKPDEPLVKADDMQKRSLEIRRNELRAEQRQALKQIKERYE